MKDFLSAPLGQALISLALALATYFWGRLKGTEIGKALVDIDDEIRKRVQQGSAKVHPEVSRVDLEIPGTSGPITAQTEIKKHSDIPPSVLDALNLGEKK